MRTISEVKSIMIKKLVVFLATFVALSIQSIAQTYSGTINDENGLPMEFVTVSLRTLPDSAVVSGVVTDADGQFTLECADTGDFIQVSMIGYMTENLPLTAFVTPRTVVMRPDNHMLEEAVVSATLPKTELKGDAVVTNIVGSVLEHTGNALDVLGKIPGMINKNGSLEVIGRGAPLYYINGRKVTDNTELRNLMSEDIKSIDVVSNPGAAYGGEVRCVVRIRTVRRQGDGFSFALTSQAKQHIYDNHDTEPSWSVLDLNYRTKGVDIFGKLVYWNQRGYQISDIYGGTYTRKDDYIKTGFQEGILDYRAHNGGWEYVLGINWQINENHSLGIRFDDAINNISNSRLIMDDDVMIDGVLVDHVYSVNDGASPVNKSINGNIYYDGNIDKLNINFNADFVKGDVKSNSHVEETSWSSPVTIDSNTESTSVMGAGKLILSYPIWKGKFQLGAEETYVYAREQYAITKQEIPSSKGSINENTIAGFAEYALSFSFGQLSAGIRYEHVNYDFVDDYTPANNLSRVQNNWFPSFSFSTMAGPVGLSLSYTGKTLRPRFNLLSSEITYDNRFTYQTGDPKLENEIQRTLSLNVNWKWLTFSGIYETVLNSIYQRAYPYNEDGVVMIKYANMKEPVQKLNLYLNASPTIGVWNLRYTVGLEKQFFSTTVIDPRTESGTRTDSYNRPAFLVQANNAFRFKHSWLIDLDYQYVTPFDQLLMQITKPIQNLNLAVSKSFLKDDALNIRLSWNDILNSSVYYFTTDYGSCLIRQSNNSYNPCVQLRVSYRFNSASSKYKGTGAGQSAKDRM